VRLAGAQGRPRVRLRIATAHAMTALGERLARVLRAGDLVVLSGDLGAGKTTLTRGIGAGLGVRGEVTSPTFVIARVHPPLPGGGAAGLALVHVDAYRLGSFAEVDDLDLDASLEDAVTVVEWGEGLVEPLAQSRLEIKLIRPHGRVPAEGADGPSGGGGGDAGDGGGDAGDGGGDAGDEPRTVEIFSTGPRWAGVDLTDLSGLIDSTDLDGPRRA